MSFEFLYHQMQKCWTLFTRLTIFMIQYPLVIIDITSCTETPFVLMMNSFSNLKMWEPNKPVLLQIGAAVRDVVQIHTGSETRIRAHTHTEIFVGAVTAPARQMRVARIVSTHRPGYKTSTGIHFHHSAQRRLKRSGTRGTFARYRLLHVTR